MVILIGLVILVAAVVVGVAGVLANDGSAHALGGHFAVFGYHVTGSTGQLFLYGVVVGAIGFLGLSLLLAGARRTARRGRLARRDLKHSRRETASATDERNELLEQRNDPKRSAEPATDASSNTPHNDHPDGQHNRRRLFRDRSAHPEPVSTSPGNDRPDETRST